MVDAPRDLPTRIRDTLHRLEHDVDAWVATSGGPGEPPGLVPLSFDWDGADILLVTASTTPAARNLRANPRVRLGLGTLRDVVMVDAIVREQLTADVPDARWAGFVRRTGWDPRGDDRLSAFRATPIRIQSWREENELRGRTLMSDGRWRHPLDEAPIVK